MNVTDLTKHALPTLFELGKTPLIIGPHGAGKTSVMSQFANENGYRLIPFRLGQMSDAGDIKGLPEFVRDENGKAVATAFITPEDLTEAGMKKCILFLDEVNRCQMDLIQPVFQLIEKDRRLGKFELHEDSRVVAAANPPTGDYTVLDFREDKAFQSRFCHLIFDPTTQEFLDYLKAQGRPQVYIDFLRENPAMIRGKVEDFQIDYMSPDNRAHDECAKYYEIAQANNTPQQVVIEVLKGMVGTESALAFVKFADSYYSFVKGVDILENFGKVKARLDVDRVDSIHSTTQEIIDLVSDDKFTLKKKHYTNVVAFMKTIKPESSYSLLKSLFDVGRWYNTKWKDEFFNNDELLAHLNKKGMNRGEIAKEANEQEKA